MDDKFRFGIEEEYFLADSDTGVSPDSDTADRFHEVAADYVEPASHELLKGQIEIQTKPGVSLDNARDELLGMRRRLAGVAADHRLDLFAAGTHPLAESRAQHTTEMERYENLATEFGLIARRSMVCAMHIHVEVPEPDKRIGLMNRMIPFLPLFYALSVSSPFWQGHEAGIKGFRLTAFSEWPRMGVPEIFADQAEYRRFIDLLVETGAIKDSSFVWWHIRPSEHYPTLELRICDSCTRVEDAVAIASLYRALLRTLVRRPDINDGVGPVDRSVCAENIWRVQQRGTEAELIDSRRGGSASVRDHLEAVIALAEPDADALDARGWIASTRDIIERGSGADRQLAVYRAAKKEGEDNESALRAVIASLAKDTIG